MAELAGRDRSAVDCTVPLAYNRRPLRRKSHAMLACQMINLQIDGLTSNHISRIVPHPTTGRNSHPCHALSRHEEPKHRVRKSAAWHDTFSEELCRERCRVRIDQLILSCLLNTNTALASLHKNIL
uniref:Uncharacterized protein n=1 Tax=Heterorhabditis bacteriophora TaxID=37862 RepID=A0A1I7XMV0_HETBA